MRILLYNPDNGVTRNFMPHLWMFLLQALTPPGHQVYLIDGNAQPMDEEALIQYIRHNQIDLVGIGAMTRMVAKAYRMADAVRSIGVPVVMGGPHVTELPDEALGKDGGSRHADAVALGEADALWPQIIKDAEQGALKEVYAPLDASGQEQKPTLQQYTSVPWDQIDLTQFNLIRMIPSSLRGILSRIGMSWESLHVIPIESGRGCPYGCDFCTVTGFFGDSIRFRTNESVIQELLLLKSLEKEQKGRTIVFFVDDNFAINPRRTKSLLREMIQRDAIIPWVAQISINLLRDNELVDLIAESGAKWIFIGLESIDPDNLKKVSKGFNKPKDYAETIEKLANRDIYTITSFIFGMDGDTIGVAQRTLDVIQSWPPGLPVFGTLSPYPSTPLYDRLAEQGRLIRPKHWLDFKPFQMSFKPEKMEIEEVYKEMDYAWTRSYEAKRTAAVMAWLEHKPLHHRLIHFLVRLAFRGIYFPQMSWTAWVKVLFENRRTIMKLLSEIIKIRFARGKREKHG
jgi:radical SAM superfamily enzyme YgiQ (UPF0313 family)